MQITFWGVRGSIATPGRPTARYGGNTPCVTIERADHAVLVLDAGTGARPLGEWLAERHPDLREIDVLLSHVHWDHIQGLPFFRPLYESDYCIGIHGPAPDGQALEDVLRMQMDQVVFPIPLSRVAAQIRVDELLPGRSLVSSWMVDTFPLAHPGTTFGYRVWADEGGPSVGYVTDSELGADDNYGLGSEWYPKLVERLAGVDVLIHDAMYTEEMFPDRTGWGHSTPAEAVALAVACKAHTLVLFHHDPSHDDDALDRLGAAAANGAASTAGLKVIVAREGQVLSL